MSSTSFLTKSPSSLPRQLLTSPPHPQLSASLFKKRASNHRLLMLKVSCDSAGSQRTAKSDSSAASAGLISAYGWCAALGGVGFLETAYLTLANSEALCPIGEGSCDGILNNHFASILGVPLPLYGMAAYGLVAILGLGQHIGFQNTPFDVKKTDADTVLVGMTTSMAVAATYFLYTLSTEFGGESWLYCLTSSALTFSLFLITIKNLGIDRIKEMLGSKLCMASLLIIALAASYNVFQPVSSSFAMTELPYVEKEITTESSPLAISLAKHLHSTGARLYGAFWCSHCVHQKVIFGREATKLLDYVECYPDGLKAGTKMAEACYGIDLKYFPSWEINGQVFSGEKPLEELATLSGMKLEELSH
ncbi:thiol-disulfide oxidoreductase LTO1-like [Salvia splendens]|uniref:thiol-disulfide oxidoreductase LTO1-like n=1 Tax=Salvia splendens TaxID=180675 RepID=UPI001C2733A9|nr:thiol-disulfide oxidoreductase LTO1-like [Salvia splendens]